MEYAKKVVKTLIQKRYVSFYSFDGTACAARYHGNKVFLYVQCDGELFPVKSGSIKDLWALVR